MKELPGDGEECRVGPWEGIGGGHRAFQNGKARRASTAWGEHGGSECRAGMVNGKQDMERCRHRREER